MLTPSRRRGPGRPARFGPILAAMEPRVSLVTLGVHDLERSRTFYEALGWRSDSKLEDGVVFFQSGGMVLGLWSREELAKDSGVEDSGGWGGVTLAYNVGSPADVDAFIDRARSAGGVIARAGAETFWGGYSGVFIDPDGHPWEVAHNPFWTVTDEGDVTLPSP
jgi:predicted lactoylglutathione lyase